MRKILHEKIKFFKTALSMGLIVASTSLIAQVQDTKKAEEFFNNELNFFTNSYAARQASEGKVKNVVIVDVRAAEDYKKGHIPGAINIPFNEYKNFEGADKSFPGLTKEGYNYIYCYTNFCNLAQKAARKFASLGYPVKEIRGGFQAWIDEENPIEKE